MKSYRSWTYVFYSILWSSREVESVPDLTKKTNLTRIDDGLLSVLGLQDTRTLKSSWTLTVNDQCLYEFVYKFEHSDSFPIGDKDFEGTCSYGTKDDPVKPKIASDGVPYLKSRRFWERFPDYIWATMGFNHLSVDWLPCGRRPAGYKQPQYDFSFYRVEPEYRAQNMVCKLYDESFMTVVPFEEYCSTEQDDVNGMNFFIVPGAMINRDPVVNMPFDFTHRHQTFGPIPHEGLRAWDESKVPETTKDWNDLPVFMSSYAGKLAMWQAHVPYKFINGKKRQFHSLAQRYFETTVQTMPDTWAVKYDERDGKIYFTIVGKANLCHGDFERAEKAGGGPPIFSNFEYQPIESAESEETLNDDIEDENPISGSFTSIASATILQLVMMAIALNQSL